MVQQMVQQMTPPNNSMYFRVQPFFPSWNPERSKNNMVDGPGMAQQLRFKFPFGLWNLPIFQGSSTIFHIWNPPFENFGEVYSNFVFFLVHVHLIDPFQK